VIRDEQGRVLLVRGEAGAWWLPGGGVEHGEHPLAALEREVLEETGYTCRAAALIAVLSDVTEVDTPPVEMHSVRLVYDASVNGGSLRSEAAGSSEAAAWLTPVQVRDVPLVPMLREVVLALLRGAGA
jgi:ADP-ribose pyrophosphatase YjhB (NUDIX family)